MLGWMATQFAGDTLSSVAVLVCWSFGWWMEEPSVGGAALAGDRWVPEGLAWSDRGVCVGPDGGSPCPPEAAGRPRRARAVLRERGLHRSGRRGDQQWVSPHRAGNCWSRRVRLGGRTGMVEVERRRTQGAEDPHPVRIPHPLARSCLGVPFQPLAGPA